MSATLTKTGNLWVQWTPTGLRTFTEVTDESGERRILASKPAFHEVHIEGAETVRTRVYFGAIPDSPWEDA